MDTIEAGKNSSFLVEDVAKNITVPHLEPLVESKGDIMWVGLLRSANKVWKRRVIEPHSFNVERALAIIVRGRVSVHEDWVVVQGGSGEVQDIGLFRKEFPLRVRESSVQVLHDKAIVSFVGPGKPGAIEAEFK